MLSLVINLNEMAHLGASDFPSENRRSQIRTFHTCNVSEHAHSSLKKIFKLPQKTHSNALIFANKINKLILCK